jgi:hypothetical protein
VILFHSAGINAGGFVFLSDNIGGGDHEIRRDQTHPMEPIRCGYKNDGITHARLP